MSAKKPVAKKAALKKAGTMQKTAKVSKMSHKYNNNYMVKIIKPYSCTCIYNMYVMMYTFVQYAGHFKYPSALK